MNKAAAILLFIALWAGSTRSVAIDATLQTLHAEQKANVGAIHRFQSQCCTLYLVETNANNSSVPGPAEEESEDEDNTSKEHAFQKMTSFQLSRFLQQLYVRQNALFREHHKEVEAPPPRF